MMRQVSIILILSSLAVVSSPWAVARKAVDRVPTGKTLIAVNPTSSHDRALSSQQHRFAMVLPERAGEKFSMLSLTLQSREPGAIPIPFDIKTARAFVKGANDQEQAIAIQQTWVDETGTLWIEFKPSLPPKTKLTLSLGARQLPAKTAYEYGIAACADSDYPAAILVDNGVVTIE